jgi:pilus assembly protein CpaB
MKSKTLILMVVAIGCGLAASYMTSRLIADRQTPVEEDKVSILVAKQNLSLGLFVKDPERYFEWKEFTQGQEPRKAIRNFEEIKDKRLNKPLSAEQFVTADDLDDKGTIGLPGQMPKGMRAVALKVNVDTSVGGFVLPNNRVDIVCVVRRGEDVQSKIILQNVLVLAVDQTSQRPEDKLATVSSTVTVLVTPAQAEKLSLATETGTLRLILRPFGDEESITTAGATPRSLNSSGDSKNEEQLVALEHSHEKARKAVWASKIPDVPSTPAVTPVVKAPDPPPPPPKMHTLTIFNGEQVTKAIFTLSDKESEATTKIEKSQPDSSSGAKPAPKQPLTGSK